MNTCRSSTGQSVSCEHLTILSLIKIPCNLIMPLLVLTSVCLLQWHLHIFSSRSPFFPCVLTFNRYQTSARLRSWCSALCSGLVWLLLNCVLLLLLFCHQGIFWSCRQSIFDEMRKRFSQVAVFVLHACVYSMVIHLTLTRKWRHQEKISWFEEKLRAWHLQADGNLRM